ncbi:MULTISPECIES: hypothetical protein [Methylomonas]|uniref:CopG family transcriptional regulator n=2 Tax=Methylomonas TaxID=416 RepID=A0A126T2G0_9GAMM|nr:MULTISPECIES: hypothetical protein [Methylomonas]AMK76259.1 hypothetical protein JT25_007095 [Methylomonas denitrificans]OAI00700.1 hypothetical protein A1342_17500 [Methylomonas methanica]TCV88279.1 hypothetical protein EDE11_10166 [Methylomonas methanica]
MKILNLSLPDFVLCYIKELASKKGVSIINSLRARAERADKAAFQAVLAKVPRREPLVGDEL